MFFFFCNVSSDFKCFERDLPVAFLQYVLVGCAGRLCPCTGDVPHLVPGMPEATNAPKFRLFIIIIKNIF